MKKVIFLFLAACAIGMIYYLISMDTSFFERQEQTQSQIEELQVPYIESINISEGNVVAHSQFHDNGLSCANCHQSDDNKGMRSNVCIACHDGTLGFYNVVEEIGESGFHLKRVQNTQISESTETSQSPPEFLSSEKRELTCSNCHNPHGSYSGRLLHNNPFGLGLVSPENNGLLVVGKVINYHDLVKTYNAYKDSFLGGSNAGTWFRPKNGATPGPDSEKYILVRGKATDLGMAGDGVPTNATVIKVYEYIERAATHRIPYRRGFYMPSERPWIYGYDFASPQNLYWTRFFTAENAPESLVVETLGNEVKHYKDIIDSQDEKWNKNLFFNYPKGYVYATDGTLDTVLSGEVAQGQKVHLKTEVLSELGTSLITTTNLTNLYNYKIDERNIDSETARLSIEVTNFCSTCHTDYLNGDTSSKFSFAHQNFSEYDNWNCLKCHQGHRLN